MAKPPEAPGFYSTFNAKYRLNLFHFNTSYKLFSLEPAQFPRTTVGEGEGAVCKVWTRSPKLYQASSRGYRYNLTGFGSPEPGLIFTYRGKIRDTPPHPFHQEVGLQWGLCLVAQNSLQHFQRKKKTTKINFISFYNTFILQIFIYRKEEKVHCT